MRGGNERKGGKKFHSGTGSEGGKRVQGFNRVSLGRNRALHWRTGWSVDGLGKRPCGTENCEGRFLGLGTRPGESTPQKKLRGQTGTVDSLKTEKNVRVRWGRV